MSISLVLSMDHVSPDDFHSATKGTLAAVDKICLTLYGHDKVTESFLLRISYGSFYLFFFYLFRFLLFL